MEYKKKAICEILSTWKLSSVRTCVCTVSSKYSGSKYSQYLGAHGQREIEEVVTGH